MSEFVYLMEAAGLVKIGKAHNPKKRLRQLQNCPVQVQLLHQIETDCMSWLESYLHSLYATCRVQGEWFRLSASDIARLKSIERMDRPEAFSPLSCYVVSPIATPKKPRRTPRERRLLTILRSILHTARQAHLDVVEGRACFSFLAGTLRNIARDTKAALACHLPKKGNSP